jgi:hypothetical protein
MIYLFVCVLFCDAFSSSECVVLNGMVIAEEMKGMWKKAGIIS